MTVGAVVVVVVVVVVYGCLSVCEQTEKDFLFASLGRARINSRLTRERF